MCLSFRYLYALILLPFDKRVNPFIRKSPRLLVDGLYQDYEEDDQVASRFAEILKIPVYDAKPFVLEGGAIHSDGQGTILVTESCLLSAGRNPHLSKEEIEKL